MSLFELSDRALDAEALRKTLSDPGAGAFVEFQGWVRNYNAGKRVQALAYEACESLALAEGARLVQQAITDNGVKHARCVHRTGQLDVGELAVWVGVSAGHRAEAFACCQQIIDRVKQHLPIWKKEFYVDGDSGWVNCEQCGQGANVKRTTRVKVATIDD